MWQYRAGIDVGSTTVKLVILDDSNKIIFGDYRRHFSDVHGTLSELLKYAASKFSECELFLKITGSGSINLSKAIEIDFIQEVVAVAKALKHLAPQTDVAIELGGEDAKIIYFSNGIDTRMNGICAGGTGSFIDQMASIFKTDALGLNNLARNYKTIYPIAARCGVFAKSDVQQLINQGVSQEDLAASIFQAVVNQTVSGLACGKPIRGNVALLGGPLHFLTELKTAFIKTLKLTPQTNINLNNSHMFAALGAALDANKRNAISLSELIKKLENKLNINLKISRLDPLFKCQDEYLRFCQRHANSNLSFKKLSNYKGDCFLGIDAGSTTTKLVLIGNQGEVLYSYYSNNNGNPVNTAKHVLLELKRIMPSNIKIVRSCSTGYGEELLKTAFSLDEGVVETVAHVTAAIFFKPKVECVLDIGGQDMKYIKLKNGYVDSVILNEACSSGCGSFLENFALSLGFSVKEFSQKALFADAPVDLGTRCTVFMNSNVKQAQKEGDSIENISAGLAYAVVKNALYKVIRLTNPSELGKNIVVQGGTFQNPAVLRAFEKITNVQVTCPKMSGIMGAFGATLIARSHYEKQPTSMLSINEIENLQYNTYTTHCGGCPNNCMLTVNKFSNGKKYISGNRCEKKIVHSIRKCGMGNMFEYKRNRIFNYKPLERQNAYRGKIGIPRVLNMYENYPFWATFFKKLGFQVILSPYSDKKIYELGIESIPSDSVCYPAKISHGHMQWLISKGLKTIFYPCVFYERKEISSAKNNFNCPVVISYPENLKNNIEEIVNSNIRFINPFISFENKKVLTSALVRLCKTEWNINKGEVCRAAAIAWNEQINAKKDIREKGFFLLNQMRKKGKHGIVLAGKPYHIDPEINHGIPEMIESYGFTVFTEDSLPICSKYNLRATDQWTYHSRIYSVADFVSKNDNLDLVELNSFGCGIDAVTIEQVSEIMANSNKLYTVLKIDEVNNLGAVRIRIRSLIAAIKMCKKRKVSYLSKSFKYNRSKFTKEMFKSRYTILAPQMSPIHFSFLEPVAHKHGYNLVMLKNNDRTAIDVGLQYVNNDMCFPAIVSIGQIMQAVLSGKYNTNKLAIIISQTGGCCRCSNYVGFLRKALDSCHLSHIPVISANINGIEKSSGFSLSTKLILDILDSIILGDLLMKCLYRVRPYEIVKDSTDKIYIKWKNRCIKYLTAIAPMVKKRQDFKKLCVDIVNDFDNFPIDETVKKPQIGIVGEIFVKYMPLANKHLIKFLEKDGAEVVVPDLINFFAYSIYNAIYKAKYLGKSKFKSFVSYTAIKLLDTIQKPVNDALSKSKRFVAMPSILEIAKLSKSFISLENQYGEGWLLTGEMINLLNSGVPNILCIQPFGCLPNHVIGRGVIKAIKRKYFLANIIAIDYDASASEVNQINRIELMLSIAKENIRLNEFKN